MKKNKVFSTSIKVWWYELFNMFIFLCISIVLFLIGLLILGKETIGLYSSLVKLFIIIISYIGMFLGANTIFKKIKNNKSYISRKINYIVCFMELLLFLGFGYICYINKLNVYFFIGGYILIFYQFFINYIFTSINNKKYPQKKKENNKETNEHIKQISRNEFIIDIDKLK